MQPLATKLTSRAYNFSLEWPIQTKKHALGSSLIGLSDDVFRLGIFVESETANFWRKTVGYKWVILWKSGRFKKFELNTQSNRVFYELSEIIKKIFFLQTKVKL